MRSGARMPAQRALVGFGERVDAVLGRDPSSCRRSVHDRRPPRPRAPRAPTDSRSAARDRDAEPHPDRRRDARPRSDQRQRDEHDVEPDEAVLELGDHRRRRVAGGALPEAALDGGDEVDDPGADGDAQRQDRRGGRMLGQRRGRRGERDGQPGVQQVTEQRRVTSSGR